MNGLVILKPNGLFLPISSIDRQSTVDLLSSQVGQLNTLNLQCDVLIKSNQMQENYNNLLASRIEQSTEQIEVLTNSMNAGFANIMDFLKTTTINSSVSPNKIHQIQLIQTNLNNFVTTSTTDVTNIVTNITEITLKSPLDDIDTVESLFFNWFRDNNLMNYNPKNPNQKALLRKYSKLILYLKRFVTKESVLLLNRPEENTQLYLDWMVKLKEESKHVRINVMNFLSDYHVRVEINGKSFTKAVIDKGSLTSCYKRLEGIKLADFDNYPLYIMDNITSFNCNIVVGDITAFKLK